MTLHAANKLANDQICLPLISVITIVRNGMPFIEQTIKSVIGQRNSNFEYIVIDGDSSDGTVDVIKLYEPGISKWISEKDEGISDAFNKGLSFATGDYILFLNSDDALASPDIMQIIAQNIIENDYPILLYGDYDCIDRTSEQIMYHGRVIFNPKKMAFGQVLPHPCLFTHRSYFEKYGNFDTCFRIAMDFEWLLRGGGNERIVHVPMLVTNVRDGGISAQDPKRVVSEIVAALKKNGYISSQWAELELRGYFLIRSLAKSILGVIGLYKTFNYLRKKRQKQGM